MENQEGLKERPHPAIVAGCLQAAATILGPRMSVAVAHPLVLNEAQEKAVVNLAFGLLEALNRQAAWTSEDGGYEAHWPR